MKKLLTVLGLSVALGLVGCTKPGQDDEIIYEEPAGTPEQVIVPETDPATREITEPALDVEPADPPDVPDESPTPATPDVDSEPDAPGSPPALGADPATGENGGTGRIFRSLGRALLRGAAGGTSPDVDAPKTPELDTTEGPAATIP